MGGDIVVNSISATLLNQQKRGNGISNELRHAFSFFNTVYSIVQYAPEPPN